MRSPLFFAISLLGLFPMTIFAQNVSSWDLPLSSPSTNASASTGSAGGDVSGRVQQLEAETKALREEVQRMRDQTSRLPPVEATPTAMAPAAPPADSGEYYTIDELRGEMKKLAWTKGDFTIVPYGYLWGNMVYNTERTYPGSYTLYVLSSSLQPESEFITDVRNTRLGFDVGGPTIPCLGCAKTGGKVEIDFQNSTIISATGVPSTENKATIMIRHAYFDVKNEDYRLLVGQTWDVVSPLLPGMLMYSVGWDGGNIGYRRAQFRGERYLAFSDTSLVTAQLSANQTVFEDGSASIVSEPPNWPILEGRTAWTIGERGKGSLPITVGVSGHIGQEQADFSVFGRNHQARTWSGNVDFRMPITERLGLQAECFTGENLGAFLGGIGQGVEPLTGRSIRSSGGWFEVWYDWTPRFHSHVGYSVDDPCNVDLVTVGGRTYNQFYFGNVIYDVTKNFLVGLEVSSWKTNYVNRLPGDAVRCEFVAKYGF
jgi:hypothetical protein